MKRSLSLVVLMLLAVGSWAQQISEEQARERALQYLNNNGSAKARGMAAVSRKTTAAKVGAKSIYAFNLEGGGYVIASGDSRALPVLGYSDKGNIDWEQLPDNMRAWLKSYDEAIASLGDSQDFADGNSKQGLKTRAPKAAIDPLIKTRWDQDAPYWNKTPLYDGANPNWQGQHSPTGCVATAMAQIMNYYQWPKAACKPIPEYEYSTAYENKEKIVHIDALPATTFDWDNMLEQYVVDKKVVGTDAQQDAVATLMRYCGQSCYMYYTPDFSDSDHQQVVEALIKYFGYKNTARFLKRIQYSIDDWEDLVYSELATGHPVQYGGLSDVSGHSFICDGYDGKGLFHINWGWGSKDDGFFSLSVLNPYNNSSTGSGSSGIGYSISEDMIVGIEPDTDGSSPQLVTPSASLNELDPIGILAADSVYFQYYFTSFTYGEEEVRVDFAMGTVDADGVLTPVFMGNSADSLVYYDNYHEVCIDSTAFEPGQHLRLYPMVKFRSIPGADWQLLGAKEFNVMAGRMSNGRFFLYQEVPELEITKTEITKGPGRIGVRNDLTLTIHNKSDIESTVPLYLVPLYYGDVKLEDITQDTPYSEGDAMVVGAYIRAAQTTKLTYSFKPLASGIVYMMLCMPDGKAIAGTVIEVSNVVGSYDDYLKNESYVEMTDAYTGNYQTVTPSGDGLQLGHAVYHVNIVDNTEANIPNAQPSDKVYFYASISDVNDENISEIRLEQEAVDYLKNLPAKAGDGSYALTYDLPLDIRRGGIYYVTSYFNEWLEKEKKQSLSSAYSKKSFTVNDDPSIRVEGDTILASGQPLELKVLLNTGYPYDPSAYTGDHKLSYTLYFAGADGSMTEMGTQSLKFSLDTDDEKMAAVDTLRMKGEFSDGSYLIRVSTDVSALGTLDIHISVGGTGIAPIVAADPNRKDVYTDLNGVRMNSRPIRKGIYIRNGRKEVVR